MSYFVATIFTEDPSLILLATCVHVYVCVCVKNGGGYLKLPVGKTQCSPNASTCFVHTSKDLGSVPNVEGANDFHKIYLSFKTLPHPLILNLFSFKDFVKLHSVIVVPVCVCVCVCVCEYI